MKLLLTLLNFETRRYKNVDKTTVELGYNEIDGAEQISSLLPRSCYSRGTDFYKKITPYFQMYRHLTCRDVLDMFNVNCTSTFTKRSHSVNFFEAKPKPNFS